MTRDELTALLDGWLAAAKFVDVAENGLQVEGKDDVRRVVCGVTANAALIDAAIAQGADAIVVHHGLVWGGGMRRLDGWLGARVRKLMKHDVSLYAYHLPLDAHPTLGNNVGLATALGLDERTPWGAYKGQTIGLRGVVAPQAFGAFVARVAAGVAVAVGGKGAPTTAAAPTASAIPAALPIAFGDDARVVRTVGVCTGGAADLLHAAIADRLDVYVTGEGAEWAQALAAETGVCFVAAGHHATERFGPRAVAAALVDAGVDATFVDVENPL